MTYRCRPILVAKPLGGFLHDLRRGEQIEHRCDQAEDRIENSTSPDASNNSEIAASRSLYQTHIGHEELGNGKRCRCIGHAHCFCSSTGDWVGAKCRTGVGFRTDSFCPARNFRFRDASCAVPKQEQSVFLRALRSSQQPEHQGDNEKRTHGNSCAAPDAVQVHFSNPVSVRA